MRLFKMSLALQMAIATVLGIFVGLFLGDICKIFTPWATAYVMILKITILPYLVCAILHGLGSLSGSQAKQILKKGILFVALTWIINLSIIYLINFCFAAGKGVKTGFISTTPPSINFAELLIPENIFSSLSSNIVPAVVIFSVLIGISLMHLKQKDTLMFCLETVVDALTRATYWISKITPIGTFLIMAQQVGTIQVATVKQMTTYLVLYLVGTGIVVFWIFPMLVSILTRISTLRWLKVLSPILLLAYTTNVVIVSLPYIMEVVRRETEALYPKDEKAQSPIQGIVSVVFNLPLASLFIIAFVLFSSLFYQVPLTPTGHIQLVLTSFLTGLGAVGLGSWVNSLNFLLDALNLPLEAINLYLTTLPFVAGFQSMVAAMEIASVSLFITLACRHLITWKWTRIIRGLAVIAIPVFVVFTSIKIFHFLPLVQRKTTTICDLNIQTNIKTITHVDENPSGLPPRIPEEEMFANILKSKVLRVGYNTNVPPFCFINTEGKIVGYDIAFAYELAKDLDCTLELIPIQYGSLEADLNGGIYDIAMSAISVTPKRLKNLCFTIPYMESKLVLVFQKSFRKKYISKEAISNIREAHIAVLKGTSYVAHAHMLFPDKDIIELNNYQEFAALYPSDILLWEEQEAIAWVLQHPQYYIFFPQPSLGIDSLAYAISENNIRFQDYLDQWLLLKRAQGFTKKTYDRWILNKPEKATEEPHRWSIIRDILHWVK